MAARITQQLVEVLGLGTGNARITQQLVEVAGVEDGALRVTQQFVEVLSAVTAGTEHEESASSVMSLSGSATGTNMSQSASSTMSLSSDVTVGQPINETAENTLSLVGSAETEDEIEVSATSVLSLEQTLEKNDLISVTATNVLALVSSEETAGPINESATNVLALVGAGTNNFFEVSASNTLSLVGTQDLADIFEESVSNTLSLVQTTDVSPKNVTVTSVLTLAQQGLGDTVILNRVASSTLALAGVATYQLDIYESATTILELDSETVQGVLNVTATNVLSLTSEISSGPISVSAESVLNLFGETESNIKSIEAESLLSLSQLLFVQQPINVSAENVLAVYQTETDGSQTVVSGLTQSVVAQQAIINKSITSYLSLAQSSGQVHEETVSSTLTLTQDMFRVYTTTSNLLLTQTVTGTASKGTSSTLDLTSEVDFNIDATVNGNTTLSLTQAISYYLIDENSDKVYNQFGPLPAAPTLGTATLTLTHPYAAPTLTVILRNPEFGNTEDITFTRINRETRAGTLRIFTDPNWPVIERLSVEVNNLKASDKTSLLQFFNDSLGKEVGFLDHENRQWRGFIVNPDAAVSETRRGRFTVSFEFEGSLA